MKRTAKSIKEKTVKVKTKNKKQTAVTTTAKSKNKNTDFKLLSDREVLEQFLQFTPARKNTKEMANNLLKSFSSLRDILDASYYELARIKDLGKQGALLINLAREIITRCRYEKMKYLKSVYHKKELYNYCLTHLQNKRQEFFEVLFLNSRMRLIAAEVITEGNIDNAAVSPRKIMELIFKHNAKFIICVHNHPSGDPSPSAEDIFTTGQLQEALETMSINILDHIIVGAGKVYSMERGSYIKFRK